MHHLAAPFHTAARQAVMDPDPSACLVVAPLACDGGLSDGRLLTPRPLWSVYLVSDNRPGQDPSNWNGHT